MRQKPCSRSERYVPDRLVKEGVFPDFILTIELRRIIIFNEGFNEKLIGEAFYEQDLL